MQIEDYDMQVTLPSNWVKVTKENPYDLYCFNGNGYLGIFVYHEVDLLENQTPELIYEYQIEDLFLQRENIKVVNEKKSGYREWENHHFYDVFSRT